MKNFIDYQTGERFEVLDESFFRDRKDLYDKWVNKKEKNLFLSKVYLLNHEMKKAERVKNCASFLEFHVGHETGSVSLFRANFCMNRLCPMCAWRRSLKLYGQMRKIMNEAQNENMAYLFLTLTVKNVNGIDLKNTIDDMMKGFKRFIKYKKIDNVVKAWYRALEITYNSDTDEFHPHFHIILGVNKRYFKSKDYLAYEDLRELWKKAMRLNYDPQINIKKMKGNNIDEISKSICEVVKYTVKDSDYLFEKDESLSMKLVEILGNVLKNRRLVAFGKLFKDIHKKLNLDDVEDGDLTDLEELQEEEFDTVYCAWHYGFNFYYVTHKYDK